MVPKRGCWLLCVLLLAGCVGEKQNQLRAPAGDPLLDRDSRLPATRTDASTPPSTTLGTTPAALSGGTPGNLSNDNNLAIDDRRTRPYQPVAQTRWSGNTVSGETPNRAPMTWEQARDLLRLRGATWQQLEFRDGEWHFRCAIPNPQQPTYSRQYEARAADDMSAIRAVLERIDGQR